MTTENYRTKTQGEGDEEPLVDQVEELAQAEMKRAEGRAKESVGQGMQDPELEREGKKLEQEAEREIEELRQK